MKQDSIKVFIQARMSSQRFPGKILAPLLGKPVIDHVVRNIEKVISLENIIVLTSTESSDDPLYAYLSTRGIQCFRGDLHNVYLRFCQSLTYYPCDAFIRICADSPLIFPLLIKNIFEQYRPDYDLLTNVFPRTFPKGQSVEIFSTLAFLQLNPTTLLLDDQEHISRYFYKNSNQFNIKNYQCEWGDYSKHNLSLDTLKDYAYLTRFLTYLRHHHDRNTIQAQLEALEGLSYAT